MITPLIILSTLGLFFGLTLSISAKKLHVREDPAVEKVDAVLPQTNCGACGYAGCAQFAKAVVSGEAPVTGCIAGGNDVAQAVAEIVGVTAQEMEEYKAVVQCKGGKDRSVERAVYDGLPDCNAAELVAHGSKECLYGCFGLGSCVKACEFEAITITDTGIAYIDPDKCTGCEACVSTCPRSIIMMMPKSRNIFIACNNKDRGGRVKKYCSVGCTACTLCVKAVEIPGSAVMKDNLPRLDYTTEENFLTSAYKCPSNCFSDHIQSRPKANISTACIGCGECVRICPVKGAITGTDQERHIVHKTKCIGCGRCIKVCPVDAISMWGSVGIRQNRSIRGR
ncbi:RnfABCDGE type electron transport complex subunit B [Chitinivibrio alkaliphilus]|uniref:Ion-translocating oxidoreductase complex subunit B n=1 Tax=Chitinivibrio alkaliphilus ACht1 TaxID=1313304 RepID=U7D856_9BACT|nr:RnfABCDGE type electron transport complex subunit B [Chitinivibrio alkaliphilus]ERP32123.1 electron transport complex, RnfABCDGE type, B subunit [Chitinivibrio alkaliphilus ACht1]